MPNYSSLIQRLSVSQKPVQQTLKKEIHDLIHVEERAETTRFIFPEYWFDGCFSKVSFPKNSAAVDDVKLFLNIFKQSVSVKESEHLASEMALFITGLLHTGTPKPAWRGAVELYKNRCLPDQLSPDLPPGENWAHLIVKYSFEPDEMFGLSVDLPQRIADIRDAICVRDQIIQSASHHNVLIDNSLRNHDSLIPSPLELCIGQDNLEIFKAYLLSDVAATQEFVDVLANHQSTNLLQIAVKKGAHSIVDYLLKNFFCTVTHRPKSDLISEFSTYQTVSVNACDVFNKSPLMLAIENNQLETAGLLLSYGADVCIVDQNGRSALDYANVHGHDDLLKVLFATLEKQVEDKNLTASALLGRIHLKGPLPRGIEQDLQKSFICLNVAAEADLLMAQSLLGEMYYRGKAPECHGQVNFTKACKWLEIAANKGCSFSTFLLVDLNYRINNMRSWATDHLNRSTYEYLSRAQFEIGEFYLQGAFSEDFEDPKPDYQKAFIWFNRAAFHDNVNAQYNLGKMYLEGTVPEFRGEPDYQAAYQWLIKAANKRHLLAEALLGDMYLAGQLPIQPDHQQIFNWCMCSAHGSQPNPAAMFLLAEMYLSGRIVTSDHSERLNEAKNYLQSAAYYGHEMAQKRLNELFSNKS